ncbi:formate--tetrahydrofolate ligase [Veronia nyctiphanis]|uniref:Formate--tetrahydrofolate ligase n=2 Tax=Veronia nyctiphanis TaxID=1278244 RepID=A0A4Q0YQA0_9GAMM|nr:formate--tetrahydrofolate ligase [Veronia nyctiphanis]RXJ73192.1 formate--tetrahydrofolate ligase [Veronia nyctiphanis]
MPKKGEQPPQSEMEPSPEILSDIEIATSVRPESILDVAEKRLGLTPDVLIPYGHHIAKLNIRAFDNPVTELKGKLVLVTAMTPTPAGEGKTTTCIGLSDGLNRLGINASACIREPSLGPCFGMKGGAAGGGRSQAIPMADLNLHFTGDFHAVTAAHNLLASLVDNHLHWGNKVGLDPRRISWRRVVDLNDRALRNLIIGLGGAAHGIPRESGFDITMASEVMAVLCLVTSIDELQQRLGDIIIGVNYDGLPVTVRDLGADGAMTVVLKDAVMPNLIQSLEHNPVWVHGGPFGHIAHGCNSVIATQLALTFSDVVVTEAGFGADLGAEKFIDIKCRQSGLRPHAIVLVCTLRALKMQGGVVKESVALPDSKHLKKGLANLAKHITNIQQFGITPIVAINRHPGDLETELETVKTFVSKHNTHAVIADNWRDGGEGAEALALSVKTAVDGKAPDVEMLYHDDIAVENKIHTLATKLYGAKAVEFSIQAKKQLAEIQRAGFTTLPVCIAKTPYSFSVDPKQLGAPIGHVLTVRELRLLAGAGFIVVICGDVMTMPGLPRRPAAMNFSIDNNGNIKGLF